MLWSGNFKPGDWNQPSFCPQTHMCQCDLWYVPCVAFKCAWLLSCPELYGEPLGLRRRLHSVPHVSEGPIAERLSPVRSSAAVDRVKRPSPESQSSNLWVVVGVVIPVLVVTVIVVILYWKLCRTDKLDFQPDTVANIQQRQKVSSHPCPHERPYGADTRPGSDAER